MTMPNTSTKPLSRSRTLIAAMHETVLRTLAAAPGQQLDQRDLWAAIERDVPLDDWAREPYETNGNLRWRSILSFSSVGMVKARYIEKQKRLWTLLPEGKVLLEKPFDAESYLAGVRQRYAAWKATQIQAGASPTDDAEEPAELSEAPEERMSKTLRSAHEALAAELIETIKRCDPEFFERLVVQLLLRMGYGGSRQEAGQAVGRSGDGGIDGVINEDRLGLDAIYLQAKRWEGSVGEGPIRDFKGALDARRARKGVLITTSSFTPAAIEAARNSHSYKIVLIDGARLADLMIEHNLGVSVTATYELKRLDADFFADE